MSDTRAGISKLPGTIIGYRKDGRPIKVIAGGAPGDDEGLKNQLPRTFTEEEVNTLLSRERDKLHGRLDKSSEAQKAMQAELAELQKEREAREKAADNARKAAEAAAQKAAEAEMDAKALIDKRSAELQAQYEKQQSEWASQVAGLQSQMEQQTAVFNKEREFQALAQYANDVVNQHAEEIVPELVKYITGDTKEEIDASLARVLADSAAIIAGVQNAQINARSQMPGVSTGGFTPTSPLDAVGGTKTLGAEDLKNMSMQEFAAMREKLGVAGNNVGQGRFGHLGKGLFG